MSATFNIGTNSMTGREQALHAVDDVFFRIVGSNVGFDIVWPESAATAVALRWAVDLFGKRLSGHTIIDFPEPVSVGTIAHDLREGARKLAVDAARSIRAAARAEYFG
jgi:hypothetical protein